MRVTSAVFSAEGGAAITGSDLRTAPIDGGGATSPRPSARVATCARHAHRIPNGTCSHSTGTVTVSITSARVGARRGQARGQELGPLLARQVLGEHVRRRVRQHVLGLGEAELERARRSQP
jgi:hypothetical protein